MQWRKKECERKLKRCCEITDWWREAWLKHDPLKWKCLNSPSGGLVIICKTSIWVLLFLFPVQSFSFDGLNVQQLDAIVIFALQQHSTLSIIWWFIIARLWEADTVTSERSKLKFNFRTYTHESDMNSGKLRQHCADKLWEILWTSSSYTQVMYNYGVMGEVCSTQHIPEVCVL